MQTTEDVFPIPGDFFFFKYITVFKEVCELLILFQEILSEKQNLPLCEDSGILIYIHQINSPSKIFRRLSEALILVAEVVIRRCSVKKVFLEISHNSQEKHLCQSLFFNKVAGLRTCFPVNFAKFLRTPCLKNTSWRLLLFVIQGNRSLNSGRNDIASTETEKTEIT